MADAAITIRSFRVCFDLERRIHRVDRWRLPLPYGLPVRSIGYWAAALATVLLLGRLPGTGTVVAALPVPVRLVVVPVVAAYLLTQLRVDGRAAHQAAAALLRHQLAPRGLVAFRPLTGQGEERLIDVPLARDESGARYRRAAIEGPAVVTLRYPATAHRRGRTLRIRQAAERPMWQGKRIALWAGQRLELQ